MNNSFDFYKGVQKAFIIKYIILLVTVPIVGLLILEGPSIILDLVCVLLFMLTWMRIDLVTYAKTLPFSEDIQLARMEKSKNMTRAFSSIIIVIFSGVVHFILSNLPFGVLILTMIYGVASLLLWKTKINYSKFELN
jgi:hypothetical protein